MATGNADQKTRYKSCTGHSAGTGPVVLEWTPEEQRPESGVTAVVRVSRERWGPEDAPGPSPAAPSQTPALHGSFCQSSAPEPLSSQATPWASLLLSKGSEHRAPSKDFGSPATPTEALPQYLQPPQHSHSSLIFKFPFRSLTTGAQGKRL